LITVRGRAGISRGYGQFGPDNYSGLSMIGNPQNFNRAPQVTRDFNQKGSITVSW
jgi:hypothetical protein